VFLIAGICTLAGVLLAFVLRNGRPKTAEDAEPVEIG
jgi:hypothetical protein